MKKTELEEELEKCPYCNKDAEKVYLKGITCNNKKCFMHSHNIVIWEKKAYPRQELIKQAEQRGFERGVKEVESIEGTIRRQLMKQERKRIMEHVERVIFSHRDCHKYHKLHGLEATCLDMVLDELRMLMQIDFGDEIPFPNSQQRVGHKSDKLTSCPERGSKELEKLKSKQ